MARRKGRAGRKKKAGARYPSGKLKAANNVPDMLLQHRAKMACSDMANSLRPEAGYALGQLMLRGVITTRQHDAGKAFRAAWMRWASLAGVAPHEVTQRSRVKPRPDVDPEEWRRASEAYNRACDAVKACKPSRLVWSTVEAVVMDGWPGNIEQMTMLLGRRDAVAALCAGLSALANYYRMPDRLAS